MAYLALIKGALGLQYFARSPADVFPNSPSAWNAVRRVALEVAELTPALAKGQKSASTLTNQPALGMLYPAIHATQPRCGLC